MGKLLIRDLDDAIENQLRERAAAHGRTTEEEARAIIGAALGSAERANIAALARELFGPEHGVNLPLSPRETAGEPPALG